MYALILAAVEQVESSDGAVTVQVYLAVLATLAVPWAAWVSLKLMKLDRETASSDVRHTQEIADLKVRIAKIEALFQTKLRDF